MTTGWVGDDRSGTFSAHIEYAEPGPFRFMNGPRGVGIGEALNWARGHAERVVLRLGETFYTAGSEPVTELPPIPSAIDGMDVMTDQTAPVPWAVEARTAWYRSDREFAAERLAAEVADDIRVRDVTATLRGRGFSVKFALTANSSTQASEVASMVLREAWIASGITAVPGVDYDISTVEVTRAQHSP